MKNIIRVTAAICLLTGVAGATVITFDLRNSVDLYTALDDKAGPVSYTNSGLVVTFTASEGVMNRTSSGFGINAPSGTDSTDTLDVGEWITIAFNQSVIVTNVKVSSWNTGVDEGRVKVDGNTVYTLTATGNHVLDDTVSSGSILRIESSVGNLGNGWSLDSISVNVVPEPTTFLLFCSGGLVSWAVRRASRA